MLLLSGMLARTAVLQVEKTVDIHPLKTGISVHFLSR